MSEISNNFLIPLVLTEPVDEKQLPANLPRQLDTIINHFRNQAGNMVLFTGASGSGRATAARLLGERVGSEVYRVDLAALVSKYIGETEKHLLDIFEEAGQHRLVLFFDEADALFGKRSGIRDTADRYANLDINYLLKRIEEHPGIAIISSNAPENLDATLIRAVRWKIELDRPAPKKPPSLWQRILGWFRR